MDRILELHDKYLLTPYIYPEQISESAVTRQFLSLYVITLVGGYFMYFSMAGYNYIFNFDKRLLKHPLILKNQIRQEISLSCKSMPIMAFYTTVCFVLEVNGYSKLYHPVEDTFYGTIFIVVSIVTFIFLTDFGAYWIHRGLHIPFFYKRYHKIHHSYKVSTPFASHSFHPIDGFMQSLPMHVYVFLFPMHKYIWLGMFVLSNWWTVSIHDGDFKVRGKLRHFINGTAYHIDHHFHVKYNFGQYTTLCDKVFGTFREPSVFVGDGPIHQVLRGSGNSEERSGKELKKLATNNEIESKKRN